MTRRVIPFLFAAAALFAFAPHPAAQVVKAPAGFPAVGATPVVTLIAPGSEPRQPLRYAISRGHREHMALDMTTSTFSQLDNKTLPHAQLPTLRAGVDLVATDVSQTGDVTIAATVTDVDWLTAPGADPGMVTALKAASDRLKTITGSVVVTDRAIVREAHLDVSKVGDPQLVQMVGSMPSMLQSLYLPLPGEAIGVGGKWEVRLATSDNGLQTFSKYVIELTSRTAAGCSWKLTMDQTVPPQPISNPGLPPGTAVSLTSFTGGASGTATIAFDSLAGTRELTLKSTSATFVKTSGGAQHMTTAMTVTARVAPGGPK